MRLAPIYDYIDQSFAKDLQSTQEFLRLPSVSTDRTALIQAAEWVGSIVQELGAKVDFVGNSNPPIVFAQLDLGMPKTLLIYGMYDVHSIGKQNWTSPPFAAEVRDLPGLGPCIIARGACNSKGPLVAFLNALRAMHIKGEIPVNLIMTIEGEEEIGSPTLRKFYEQNTNLLKADAGFEPFWAEYGTDVNNPTIALGTKGIVVLELVCRGGAWGGPHLQPVHSSVGGWIASPTWRLINALSSMIDKDETITIEGFDEEVVPPNPQEERLLSKLAETFDRGKTLALVGAERFKYSLDAVDLLRKYLYSPTLNVNFLSHGDIDEIPNESRAELSIRLPPSMDPGRTIERIREHLDRKGFSDIQISRRVAYPWAKTDLDSDVVKSLIATYHEYHTEPEIWPLMAGATPYYLFSGVLRIPYASGGLGKAGRSHSADEYAVVEDLRLFEKSIVTFLTNYAST